MAGTGVRLQEVHPSVVHFPIAFLPLAIGADAIGRATDNRSLMAVGRTAIALAAGGAAIAGATGLIAQQEVDADGRALDLLVTHRNLNLVALAGATALAVTRWTAKKPGIGYLLAGLASVALVGYTAYLGGHMVYEYGVGVKAADGLKKEGTVPALVPGQLRRAAREAGRDLVQGAQLTVKEIGEGKLAPAITHSRARGGGNGASRSGEAAGQP